MAEIIPWCRSLSFFLGYFSIFILPETSTSPSPFLLYYPSFWSLISNLLSFYLSSYEELFVSLMFTLHFHLLLFAYRPRRFVPIIPFSFLFGFIDSILLLHGRIFKIPYPVSFVHFLSLSIPLLQIISQSFRLLSFFSTETFHLFSFYILCDDSLCVAVFFTCELYKMVLVG